MNKFTEEEKRQEKTGVNKMNENKWFVAYEEENA